MESSDDSFVWTDASCAYEASDDGLKEETMNEINEETINSESEEKYKKKLQKKRIKSESEIKYELLNSDIVKPEPDSDAPPPSSKRKRKRERTPSSDGDAHDLLDALVKKEQRDTHIESSGEIPKKRKKKHVEESYETKDSSQESEALDSSEYISKKKKSKRKKLHQNFVSSHDGNDEGNDEEQNVIQKDMNGHAAFETDSKKTKKQRVSKLSDRIQFEDGEDIIAGCNDTSSTNITTDTPSAKLRRFLKANPQLHSLPYTLARDAVISQDDDIWLLNCPHEINILSLKDSDLTLDNKCKIKIDSHRFVGNIENDIDRVAILTFEYDKPVLKSLPINGIVNFRKRIPKPHFMEDNVITNNQTDFIPLPDTKQRHPLFGSDYKKAMKIPSTVKSRLTDALLEAKPSIKEVKKKNKHKHREADMDEDVPVTDALLEAKPYIKEVKKKKKHKHRETDMDDDVPDGTNGRYEEPFDEVRKRKRRRSLEPDQPARKKTKKIKQEQESVETWDSEKAIEENLFNF